MPVVRGSNVAMSDSLAAMASAETAIGRPTATARRLVNASVSDNTRRAYAGALGQLDDAALAAYLAELHDAGRAGVAAASSPTRSPPRAPSARCALPPPRRQRAAWSRSRRRRWYGRGCRHQAPRHCPLLTGRFGKRAHQPRRVDYRCDARRKLENIENGGALLRWRDCRARRRGALPVTGVN